MYSIHLSISQWKKQFLVLEAVFQPHLSWKWTLTASRGLRPLEAIKSFISCPCEAGKQPLTPKIIFLIRKMTNEWSKVLFSTASEYHQFIHARPTCVLLCINTKVIIYKSIGELCLFTNVIQATKSVYFPVQLNFKEIFEIPCSFLDCTFSMKKLI